jgi:hypothetical protein
VLAFGYGLHKSQYLTVEAIEGEVPSPTELRGAGENAQARPIFGEEFDDESNHLRDGVGEEAGAAVVDQFGDAAGGIGDNGHTGGKGFQNDSGRGFVRGRRNEQEVEAGEHRADVVHPAGEFDGEAGGSSVDVLVVTKGRGVREERRAIDDETAEREHAVDGGCSGMKSCWPFSGEILPMQPMVMRGGSGEWRAFGSAATPLYMREMRSGAR